MPDESESALERVVALSEADKGALERLGISILTVEVGRVELTMTVDETMANSLGLCHGGFLFALADTAFAYALASVGAPPATLQASISFVRGAKTGQTVRAVGNVSHSGRSTGFATVRLLSSDDMLVAEFQGAGIR